MTDWILSSSVLIVAVLALRKFCKGRISQRFQYSLWGLVLLRLLIPVSLFQSGISLENLTQSIAARPNVQAITQEWTSPRQDYENVYNEVLQEYEDLTNIPVKPPSGDPLQDEISVTSPVATVPVSEQLQIQQEVQKRLEKSTPLYSLKQILVAAWVIGMLSVGAALLFTNWHFSRRLKRTRIPVKTASSIPVYVSHLAETPCLFGLLRPVIYLTPEIMARPDELQFILAHETTHFHHKDHIWAFLRCICLILHWYNPLVWVAATLSRKDCELACDEATVMRIGEENRIAYGKTLVDMTCIRRSGKAALLTATTMLSDKKSLTERIRLIAKKPTIVISAVVTAVLIAAIAVGCTFTGAPNTPEETVPPETTAPIETTRSTQPPETVKYTEPESYEAIVPTHGVDRMVNAFLIYYNGNLYTATDLLDTLPDGFASVGKVLVNNDYAIPEKNYNSSHLAEGSEVFSSGHAQNYICVAAGNAYWKMVLTEFVDNFAPMPSYTGYKDGEYTVGSSGDSMEEREYVFLSYSLEKPAALKIKQDDEIVLYAEFVGHFFWTPQKGQNVILTGGYFRPSEQFSVYADADGNYGPGMYRVGIDIPAGRYQLTGKGSSCAFFKDASEIAPYYSTGASTASIMILEEGNVIQVTSGLLSIHVPSAQLFPDPPEVKAILAVPEGSTEDTLVTPYWEQAILFKMSSDYTETIYARIPEIYPFSEEAIACQQEIYKLYEHKLYTLFYHLADGLDYSYTLLDPSTTYGQEGGWPNLLSRFDYTASYQGGILSIVVGIQDRNSGQFDYYPFELKVPTGQEVQTDPRLNVSDAQIAKTLGDYYKELYSDFDPNFDHYQQCLQKTVSQENIDACQLFVAQDGTVMVIGYIYTMAGADYMQKIIPLSS